MRSVLYLAWRYALAHKWKCGLMVAAMSLILLIPAAIAVLAARAERHFAARADATPYLVGAKGSPLELTLNSLYFRSKPPETILYAELTRIHDSGLALPIPLHVKFRSQTDPVVGTSLDYFAFRKLRPASGRLFGRLGDCVVGANVARRRSLNVDDRIVTNPERAFDPAGARPLKMRITGVLAFAGSPDDDAVFVDVKTAWILEGIGHGHAVRRRSGDSSPQATEITDDNLESFHFHGDMADFPMTALLAVPPDEKSATRLIGRIQAPGSNVQIVEPAKRIGELLRTVVAVKSYALGALLLVGGAALVLLALVQVLSLKLRQREIAVLHHIGASRGRVFALLASEAVGVIVAGAILATLATIAIANVGPDWVLSRMTSAPGDVP
jgi:putative ABC transport system permease protein